MSRRKELKEQYKHIKPPMGLFIIRSNFSNKCYIEATWNLRNAINSTKFKLGAGLHPNKELQKVWKDKGEVNFTVEILDNLEYDKDESKTDYKEDLALLKMIWEEKMTREYMSFYEK